MTASHAIVPWTCHTCGRSFAETSGGLCADCRRATCPACFPLSQIVRTPGMRRCRLCVAADRRTAREELEHVLSAMSNYPEAWWVAGGWAIDLHLGGQHRPHNDVDIAVLRRDQQKLRSCFSSWSLRKVVSGAFEPWQPDEVLQWPIHEVHAMRNTEHLEFLFNERNDDLWVFRRNPSISMRLERVSRRSAEGISYLCPEIVLLYKAKTPRKQDTEDFHRVCPTLDARATQWLVAALDTCHPGHEWLSTLRTVQNR